MFGYASSSRDQDFFFYGGMEGWDGYILHRLERSSNEWVLLCLVIEVFKIQEN